MLFEITVYRSERNQTTRNHAMEVEASDAAQALERAAIRFHPERVIEIRAKEMRSFQPGTVRAAA
jgi:hypothetical protein